MTVRVLPKIGLVLRATPALSGTRLTAMPQGALAVVVGGPSADGRFWQLRYQNQTGWASDWPPGSSLAPAAAPRTARARQNETWEALARRLGVDLDELRALNPGARPIGGRLVNQPTPPTTLYVTGPQGTLRPRTYTMKRGDSLRSLAKRAKVTPKALRAANPGLRFVVGDKIALPEPPRRRVPGRAPRAS
jgi:LysM repeat protein